MLEVVNALAMTKAHAKCISCLLLNAERIKQICTIYEIKFLFSIMSRQCPHIHLPKSCGGTYHKSGCQDQGCNVENLLVQQLLKHISLHH